MCDEKVMRKVMAKVMDTVMGKSDEHNHQRVMTNTYTPEPLQVIVLSEGDEQLMNKFIT